MATSVSMLEVPGAMLSHQTIGSGTLLLCIPAATDVTSAWERLARILSSSFTVCTYHRRGFKDSRLTGPQDGFCPEGRLVRDADDAAALIAHLSPGRSAYVVGNTSGGVVGLQLLQRHPNLVRSMICYEPPLVTTLPIEEARTSILQTYNEIYETFRSQSTALAVEQFVSCIAKEEEADFMRQTLNSPANRAETEYWLEYELRQYPAFEPNYELLMQQQQQLPPPPPQRFQDSGPSSSTSPSYAASASTVNQGPSSSSSSSRGLGHSTRSRHTPRHSHSHSRNRSHSRRYSISHSYTQNKLFLMYGRASVGKTMHAAVLGLSSRCQAQVRSCPGGHIAYATDPLEFAEVIIKAFLPTPPGMWPMLVS